MLYKNKPTCINCFIFPSFFPKCWNILIIFQSEQKLLIEGINEELEKLENRDIGIMETLQKENKILTKENMKQLEKGH